MWYLIVSISDLCTLTYFYRNVFRRNTRPDVEIPASVQLDHLEVKHKINPIYVPKDEYIDDDVHL